MRGGFGYKAMPRKPATERVREPVTALEIQIQQLAIALRDSRSDNRLLREALVQAEKASDWNGAYDIIIEALHVTKEQEQC